MSKQASVVILGGGIHGAGTLHDLASRGFKKIYLIEKKNLASGTSSKSTKLIHGGLRYLERPRQIHMVYESLQERKLLLELAPDLVKPLELLLPIKKKELFYSLKMKIGLTLYDYLARKSLIKPHKTISFEEALKKAPLLKEAPRIEKFYSYWDAQTDDKLLVQRVALSGVSLGGKILEETEVISLINTGSNWELVVSSKGKPQETIQTQYVINCLGPWSNDFLQNNGFTPTHLGKNNKGTHLLLKDFGLKSGLLLKAIDDRLFFVLPWKGKTLIGTTEKEFKEKPCAVEASTEEITYLLKSCNKALGTKLTENDIESTFSGLRWLAKEEGKNLTKTSRESVLGKIENQNGFVLTVYGGKLTSYRRLCEKIGNIVTEHSSLKAKTKTHLKESWL